MGSYCRIAALFKQTAVITVQTLEIETNKLISIIKSEQNEFSERQNSVLFAFLYQESGVEFYVHKSSVIGLKQTNTQ